jgi:hypothetical protein
MKIKQPKPNKGKKFKLHEDTKKSSQQERPLFSFEFLHHDARYSLSACTTEEKSKFIEKIVRLSQLTWAEIQSSGKHQLGIEKIPANQIKANLHPEADSRRDYLAFRCVGKAPMVGYRVRRIFYILWIDRNFTLYKH